MLLARLTTRYTARMSPLEQLRETAENLPTALRERILALGADAVPELIAIMLDEDLGGEGTPADGWPPIHAVDLLADLGAVEAIEPMLDVLEQTEDDDIVHDRILLRLPSFGASLLEPALSRLDDADEVFRSELLSVLAESRVRDERVFALIRSLFDEDAAFAAIEAAEYGDPRALPLIEEHLRALRPADGSQKLRMEMVELVEAHRALGGSFDDALQAHVDVLRKAAFLDSAPRAPARSVKVGRNDPCPCGSGKKYKKCCIDKATDPRVVRAGEGDADAFASFAEPLIEATDGSREQIEQAVRVAQALWNVGLLPSETDREAVLDDLLADVAPAKRAGFEALAREMIARVPR